MTFQDLELKIAYSSDYDDTIKDFYIPVLSESIEYCRLTGFFSSASLALSAIGILKLIENGGKMRLITSPKLSNEDISLIQNAINGNYKKFEEKWIEEIDSIKDDFVRDHIFAIGWMLANNKLEIKIAIPYSPNDLPNGGIFHQKVGIFKDSIGEYVSFSGSVNESFSGWSGKNTEEFKVYKSWEPAQLKYLESDLKKFDRYWNNLATPRLQVVDIFDAVKKHLIEISPRDISEIDLQKHYSRPKKAVLFEYQNDAIENWFANGCKGIFEMATGTGKTFTSLGCIEKLLEQQQNLLTIISCPYNHLLTQWKKEILNFGIEVDRIVIADRTNQKWPNDLTNLLYDIEIGTIKSGIVFTTHTTVSSEKFINIIKRLERSNLKYLFIVDEVHGIGSEKRMRSLLDLYDFKLGLSATPQRAFDSEGTDIIYDYFGGVVFQFSLSAAINEINPKTNQTYLTPYYYHPIFIDLTSDEMEEYSEKTRRIGILYRKENRTQSDDNSLEYLLRQRANILKNAENKYPELICILNNLSQSLSHTIIYCSENDKEQISNVNKILSDYNLNIHQFTMNEGVKALDRFNGLSEREYILKKFGEGEYNVLVAQKCLDEGVDVPPARRAILLASSKNPRQYIQRIGRVIRQYPDKENAEIYDFIVTPSTSRFSSELQTLEKKIYEKELDRALYIAEKAINSIECTMKLYEKKRTYG